MSAPQKFGFPLRVTNLRRLLARAYDEKRALRGKVEPPPGVGEPRKGTLLQVLLDAGMLDDDECERACVECATLYTGSLACPTCSAPGEPLGST